MPFLVKPLDCVIIHRVRLSGEDLNVAFTFKFTLIHHIKPIPMHPCFISINTIVITNTVIRILNVCIFNLAETIFMW